jgi:hypothetical protein
MMWIRGELHGKRATIIPIMITAYCIQMEAGAASQTPFGTDADRIEGMEAGCDARPEGRELQIPARTARRSRGYIPRRTAIVYASGSRTAAARRFTSERLTAAIFSGAANVSSYPVPYSSL